MERMQCLVLLMVLFENVHVLNCRSETQSVFRQSLFGNPFLIIGTISAQLINIAAMYTPWLNSVLRIKPVSFEHWFELLTLALILLIVIEAQKLIKSEMR